MKNLVVVFAFASTLMACGQHETSNLKHVPTMTDQQVPMLDYRLYFTDRTFDTIEMHVEYKGRAVKSQLCSITVNGSPSLDGPQYSAIVCNPDNGGVEAKFILEELDQSQFWLGSARFYHNNERGGEFACYSEVSSAHDLDCFWKAGSEPPPAGSVSN